MNAMSKKTELQDALKLAMKANDELRKRTLRLAMLSIRIAEDEKRADLDENEILAVLQKEVKSRREVVEDANRAGRPELATQAEAEMRVLEEFLPQPMTDGELESFAKAAIIETGATSPAEMGQVMKILMPRIAGRATGQQASQVVRKLLQ